MFKHFRSGAYMSQVCGSFSDGVKISPDVEHLNVIAYKSDNAGGTIQAIASLVRHTRRQIDYGFFDRHFKVGRTL